MRILHLLSHPLHSLGRHLDTDKMQRLFQRKERYHLVANLPAWRRHERLSSGSTDRGMKMKKERGSTVKAMFSPYLHQSLFLGVLLLFQLIHLPEAHADISGTVYADEGVTNVGAGKVVRLLTNGVSQGTSATDASGNYTIINSAVAGDALLVYIDGDATYDGTTVTVTSGASLAGIDIYADHIITRQDNGGSLTNANMDAARGAYVDAEILYSVAAGALTVMGANTRLYVPAGQIFAPGGNVSTVHVKIKGTCDAQSHTITASGNWDSNSGTFTAGTSSVVLDGTGSLDSTGDAFYNLTVGAATRTTTITSNLIVNNVLTIAASTGTITDGAVGYNITLAGDGTPFVNNGAAVSANRFIYGSTSSSTVAVAGGTYNVTDKLWISGGNSGAGTSYQLNGNLVVNGKLDVSPSVFGVLSLDTSVSNYNITANGLTVSSDFFVVGSLSANGSAIDINGDVLLIDAVTGSVDMGSSYWTVSGNWTNAKTAGFLSQTSTLELNGTAQTMSGNTMFNNFKKTVTSADTLTFAAGSTQTIKGTVTLAGASGQLLSLRSSAPGANWNFIVNAGATKAIDYVAVMDSDASGSDISQKPVNPTNSINLGNNVAWFTDTCPTVTNTNNSGTGSLRACIDYANGNPGTTIRFNIPGADPGKQTVGADSWWRIVPLSSLPTITANNTIIDGTTQTAFIGGDPNTLGPEIQLFGNGAAFNGLTITSAGNTVKGLIIGRFDGGAVTAGMEITGAAATNNVVQGNYIGVDYKGTAMEQNRSGIRVSSGAKSTVVGGTAANAANRIAYNNGAGIDISGVDTDGNIFSANSIFDNTGLGISLAGDGSNNNKAAPTINTITPGGGNFIVIATVPATGDTIEFFRANNGSSPAVTPDSPAGEGYLFLGSCVDNGGACVGPYVSGSDTDGVAGTMSVTLTGGGLAALDTLSATATDAVNGTSAFAANNVVPLKLIKQIYNASGACIASSDAADAGCGSTSVVTVPAGVVIKFMIIVKNTSAQAVTDVRFQDVLDESSTGFSYLAGSMTSSPVGVSAPADTASNAVIYTAATDASSVVLTDGAGDDIGSARDLVGPAGTENISIGNVNPGGINTLLTINANKSFAMVFQARKK
ncbi:MAG: hypothetical protein M0R70_05310 [Nitrospirae bacterium]|nr:hypothetical protein [Nitrospirota bacterium]